MNGVPVPVSILIGVVAGLCVVLLHAVAGYALVNRSIRFRVTARVLAVALVVAGLVVGVYVTQAMTTSAITTDANDAVPGVCTGTGR